MLKMTMTFLVGLALLMFVLPTASTADEARMKRGADAQRVVDEGQILDTQCTQEGGLRECLFSVLYASRLWDCRMNFYWADEKEVSFRCMSIEY